VPKKSTNVSVKSKKFTAAAEEAVLQQKFPNCIEGQVLMALGATKQKMRREEKDESDSFSSDIEESDEEESAKPQKGLEGGKDKLTIAVEETKLEAIEEENDEMGQSKNFNVTRLENFNSTLLKRREKPANSQALKVSSLPEHLGSLSAVSENLIKNRTASKSTFQNHS